MQRTTQGKPVTFFLERIAPCSCATTEIQYVAIFDRPSREIHLFVEWQLNVVTRVGILRQVCSPEEILCVVSHLLRLGVPHLQLKQAVRQVSHAQQQGGCEMEAEGTGEFG